MLIDKALLPGKLIVSCQAAPHDPLDTTDTIRRIARAVVAAGASGLRINSAEHVAAIRQDTNLPIIGIKKRYRDGKLFITPDFAAAADLARAGASIIALDCTAGALQKAEPWQALIERIHRELKLPVMADISTLEEARTAAEQGADYIGTTLNGYTPQSMGRHGFDWQLLADIVTTLRVPIIAEGHIATPQDARRAIDLGASAVVVGSAITRPGNITQSFLRAIRPPLTRGFVVGVDIGGTRTKAALVDEFGTIEHCIQVPTAADQGKNAICSALMQAVELVLGAINQTGQFVSGLGIATAGVVNVHDGSILAATNNLPGWSGFPLRAFATERYGLPCRVINDGQAAALAELHYGAARGRQNIVAISLGTGVGGGIILGGKLVRGQYGFAGTVGHHVIRVGGRPCNCGRKGCLEAYVSTAALIHEYQQFGGRFPDEIAHDNAARATQIGRLSGAGDPIARRTYEALTEYLAEGLANISNLFDPEMIILTGGLFSEQPHLLSLLQQQVFDRLHFGAVRKPVITASATTTYAGVKGAAALFVEASDGPLHAATAGGAKAVYS